MITPQQIHETSFETVRRGGYDMEAVDNFLEPLTEDYITLFKENSVLKSKMRILVEKLEEYRTQESSMQNALLAAQKTCDQMLLDTEKKCAKMLREAEEAAADKTKNVSLLIGEEQERLETAQNASRTFLDNMEENLKQQLSLLQELREREFPGASRNSRPEPRKAFDFDEHPTAPTTEEMADALIQEIGMNLESKLNPAPAPTAEPVKKFEGLQFGANYSSENL